MSPRPVVTEEQVLLVKHQEDLPNHKETQNHQTGKVFVQIFVNQGFYLKRPLHLQVPREEHQAVRVSGAGDEQWQEVPEQWRHVCQELQLLHWLGLHQLLLLHSREEQLPQQVRTREQIISGQYLARYSSSSSSKYSSSMRNTSYEEADEQDYDYARAGKNISLGALK